MASYNLATNLGLRQILHNAGVYSDMFSRQDMIDTLKRINPVKSIDPQFMYVNHIKNELFRYGMDPYGRKETLIKRLRDARWVLNQLTEENIYRFFNIERPL